jgi:hypothetical protein
MDEEFEKKLASVVERLRRSQGEDGAGRDRDRRKARERVLAELPRLEARIRAVMAEINDTLATEGMALRLATSNHSPVAEAVYTINVTGVPYPEPILVLIAEGQGRVRAMLERDHHRALLESVDAFDLDKAKLAHLVLALLEAHA